MWGDHRTAPPPVILEHQALCFLMIIKLHSRCWVGKLSSSGPSANKHMRRENLEGDDKVALSPSSAARKWQTATSFYFSVHVEAILMCRSCAISVSQSFPSPVGGSINQSNSNLSSSWILGSCECQYYVIFLEDRTQSTLRGFLFVFLFTFLTSLQIDLKICD